MNRNLIDILVCPYSKSSLRLEVFQSYGDEIEFGLLHSEAEEYPIIAGIPILLPGCKELVNLIKCDRFKEAVALATMGSIRPSGVWRVGRWLQDTYRFRKVGRYLEHLHKNRWLPYVINVLFPFNGKKPSARRLFQLAYKEYQIRSTEVFNYNYYRYSMPRHLVALSFANTMGKPDRPILDLACGAGHITWFIQQQVSPQQTIGLDNFFFSLYVAYTCIAPNAWFVCADANTLPFRDSSFSVVFCSDAFFSFQAKWSSLREIERVLDNWGVIMLVGLRNKLLKHLYPGKSLTPYGYKKLVEHLRHRLIPDFLILERYLDGYGLPAAKEFDEEILNQATSVSILATKGKMTFVDFGPFDKWPHALYGILGVNPLYELEYSSDDTFYYIRRFPSKFYEDENPEMKHYLPLSFSLSKQQQIALKKNSQDNLEDLIQRCAILGFPPGYLD